MKNIFIMSIYIILLFLTSRELICLNIDNLNNLEEKILKMQNNLESKMTLEETSQLKNAVENARITGRVLTSEIPNIAQLKKELNALIVSTNFNSLGFSLDSTQCEDSIFTFFDSMSQGLKNPLIDLATKTYYRTITYKILHEQHLVYQKNLMDKKINIFSKSCASEYPQNGLHDTKSLETKILNMQIIVEQNMNTEERLKFAIAIKNAQILGNVQFSDIPQIPVLQTELTSLIAKVICESFILEKPGKNDLQNSSIELATRAFYRTIIYKALADQQTKAYYCKMACKA